MTKTFSGFILGLALRYKLALLAGYCTFALLRLHHKSGFKLFKVK